MKKTSLKKLLLQLVGASNLSTTAMYFTDRQLELIADAIEDYAVLIDEDAADECGEILDIIEAHFQNK